MITICNMIMWFRIFVSLFLSSFEGMFLFFPYIGLNNVHIHTYIYTHWQISLWETKKLLHCKKNGHQAEETTHGMGENGSFLTSSTMPVYWFSMPL
jgi:hypothetical protein